MKTKRKVTISDLFDNPELIDEDMEESDEFLDELDDDMFEKVLKDDIIEQDTDFLNF